MSMVHETDCHATAEGLNKAIRELGIDPSQIIAVFETDSLPHSQADAMGRPVKMYRVIWHD